jgi:hypothetical protein
LHAPTKSKSEAEISGAKRGRAKVTNSSCSVALDFSSRSRSAATWTAPLGGDVSFSAALTKTLVSTMTLIE